VFNVIPLFAVPVAVGIAVLRHRLWDLDLVVVRTLTSGVLAFTVAAIYVIVVAGIGGLIGAGTGSDLWLAVLATAIAGAVFQPVREAAGAAARRLVFGAPHGGASTALTVRTLGGFRVERAGQPVSTSAWQSKKARQLLKMLIVRRGRPVHREVLIDALWPGDPSMNLGNRLSVALSTVRAVLDPDKARPNDHFVKADADTLQLDLDHVAVDVELFLATAEVGLRTNGPELDQAAALHHGDFLEEDLFEDWSQPLRDEVRATHLSVLRALADARTPSVDAALAAHRRILEIDPYDEAAHLAIVSVLRTAGRHGEAQRAHRRYVARMRELGVPPTSV
jgi:DNA-binding SARP family transcriptional activator